MKRNKRYKKIAEDAKKELEAFYGYVPVKKQNEPVNIYDSENFGKLNDGARSAIMMTEK